MQCVFSAPMSSLPDPNFIAADLKSLGMGSPHGSDDDLLEESLHTFGKDRGSNGPNDNEVHTVRLTLLLPRLRSSLIPGHRFGFLGSGCCSGCQE